MSVIPCYRVVLDSYPGSHSCLVSKYTVINFVHKGKSRGTGMSCRALGQCCIQRIAGRGVMGRVSYITISYINILTKQSKQWTQIPYEKHRLSRGCAGIKAS